MCGKRLKAFLLLSGLSLLSSYAPLLSYSYADVILTDKEAEELMSEIQLSRMELQNVKNELTESKSELSGQKAQLEDVRNTCTEQKKSYETQLDEAQKENRRLKRWLTITATTSVLTFVLSVILIVL